MADAPRTWTASGYSAVLEHERILDELCDLVLDLQKVTWAALNPEDATDVARAYADSLPGDFAAVINKLSKWEDKNLVR